MESEEYILRGESYQIFHGSYDGQHAKDTCLPMKFSALSSTPAHTQRFRTPKNTPFTDAAGRGAEVFRGRSSEVMS